MSDKTEPHSAVNSAPVVQKTEMSVRFLRVFRKGQIYNLSRRICSVMNYLYFKSAFLSLT